MTKIFVQISPGELVDRATILRLKSTRISDPLKLEVVRAELARHEDLVGALPHDEALRGLMERLLAINAGLWEIEDALRVYERGQNFGPEFIELARAVYLTNDARAATKREIDKLLGSAISEVKSYGEET